MILKQIPQTFPRHNTYVDVFSGGSIVTLAKPPSPVDVYNDLDSGHVDFFRVLRDPVKFARFKEMEKKPTDDVLATCDTWWNVADTTERAYRWFVLARYAYEHGLGRYFASQINLFNKTAAELLKFLNDVDGLMPVYRRLMEFQVESQDYKTILDRYDTKDSLFYCRPPASLKGVVVKGFRFTMSDEEHKDLIGILVNLKGKCVVHSNAGSCYDLLSRSGWKTVKLDDPEGLPDCLWIKR